VLRGHLVSLPCLESIPEFLRDPIPQARRGEDLSVRHPGQRPGYRFLASRRFPPHLDTAVPARSELLVGMPLPLGDVNGPFRSEQQPDLDRPLDGDDAECLPGARFGAKLGRAREDLPPS
jgi:hypothetical protein